jgi:hypothetical protein
MKILPTLLTLSFLISTTVHADAVKLKGHRYPRQVEAKGVAWEIKGAEHFVYKVFFSVFTGAYYEQTDGEGKRLKFTYTRNLKAKDLVAQADKQLTATNPPEVLRTYAEPLQGIQDAYVDVKEGDSYVITAIPGKGTWLELNGEEKFFTDNGDFGIWYLNIWLGDPPINDDLKEALTTGKNI